MISGPVNAAAQASSLLDKALDYLIKHSGNILSAMVIIIAALVAGRWMARVLDRALEKKHLEPPVRILISRVARLLMLALGAVLAAQNLGVEVMPLVAGLSVAGVGVGLAMQGMLSNMVAGLVIIFVKPFRVGDYVELLGVHGQVTAIELFSTRLMHPDQSRVIVPNRKVIGEIMHNYGTIRQLDLTVGVSYSTNLNAALAVIRDVLKANKRVLKEPVAVVGVSMLANSSINISVKPWTKIDDMGDAQAELYQALVDRFRETGIELPFPQREIRVIGGGGPAKV